MRFARMRWFPSPQWLRRRRFEAARRAGREQVSGLDPAGRPYPYYWLGRNGTECYSCVPNQESWRDHPLYLILWSWQYTAKRVAKSWYLSTRDAILHDVDPNVRL